MLPDARLDEQALPEEELPAPRRSDAALRPAPAASDASDGALPDAAADAVLVLPVAAARKSVVPEPGVRAADARPVLGSRSLPDGWVKAAPAPGTPGAALSAA